jgi:hypothetical protein
MVAVVTRSEPGLSWGVVLVGWAAACGGAPAPTSGPTDEVTKPEVVHVAAQAQASATPPEPAVVSVAPPESATPAAPVIPPVSQEIADAPGAPELLPGAAAVKRGEWGKARIELESAIKKIAASQDIAAIMAGHALLGRACDRLNDRRCAAKEFAVVAALWQDPSIAMKKLDAFGGDEAARSQRLVRALLAVGEAHYFFAEQKRKEAEKMVMPPYTGGGSREDVLKHVSTRVADWSKKTQRLIEDAENAYLKVVQIQPFPPPRWVIDSAARVGAMWYGFVLAFRAAPLPREWAGSGPIPGGSGITYEELRQVYLERVTLASDPMRARARAAFTKCHNDSVKYQYTDELSKSCDGWLAVNPP